MGVTETLATRHWHVTVSVVTTDMGGKRPTGGAKYKLGKDTPSERNRDLILHGIICGVPSVRVAGDDKLLERGRTIGLHHFKLRQYTVSASTIA